MRFRKVNRCPNKSFDKLWLQDHQVLYKVISSQLTMIACIAKLQILLYYVVQFRTRRANAGVLVGRNVDCTVFVLLTRSERGTV